MTMFNLPIIDSLNQIENKEDVLTYEIARTRIIKRKVNVWHLEVINSKGQSIFLHTSLHYKTLRLILSIYKIPFKGYEIC